MTLVFPYKRHLMRLLFMDPRIKYFKKECHVLDIVLVFIGPSGLILCNLHLSVGGSPWKPVDIFVVTTN